MVAGKAKRKGKKGKKKPADPFLKKDWYDLKAPNMFDKRVIGKTPVNRTVGVKLSSDALKGRVVEASLGDLNEKREDWSFIVFRLIVEDVQGKNCLTNFHGMRFSTDKLKSLIRKWQSLIEANVDVQTTDGYSLRMFCIGFTTKPDNQRRKTAYAQSAQIRQIRSKMFNIIQRETVKCDVREVMKKLISNTIGARILKECNGIYPLKDVYVHKVKVLKKPKNDHSRLLALHGEGKYDAGSSIDRP